MRTKRNGFSIRKRQFIALLLTLVMVIGIMPSLGVNAGSTEVPKTRAHASIDAGTVFSAGDTLDYNGSDENKHTVGSFKVTYYDADGERLLTVLSQNNVNDGNDGQIVISTYNKIISDQEIDKIRAIPNDNNVTDKWVVFKPQEADADTVYLKAIPKYTITLYWEDDEDVSFPMLDNNEKVLSNGSRKYYTIDFIPFTSNNAKNISEITGQGSYGTREGLQGWFTGYGQKAPDIINDETYTNGVLAKLDNPEGNGYSYSIILNARWKEFYKVQYYPGSGEVTFPTTYSEGITYNSPNYYEQKFTIKNTDEFNKEGNTGVTLAPNEYTRKGHHFVNWKDEENVYDVTNPDSNLLADEADTIAFYFDNGKINHEQVFKLTAQWAVNHYKVNFDANIPTKNVENPTSQSGRIYGAEGYDSIINLSTLSDPDQKYVFLGWALKSDAESAAYSEDTVSITTLIDKDAPATPLQKNAATGANDDEEITLYGVWKKKHELSFNINGAILGEAPYPVLGVSGETTVLPSIALLRSGYTLTGWNTSSSGEGTAYALGDVYTFSDDLGDETLYASWSGIPYTIRYDKNKNYDDPRDQEMEDQTFIYGDGQKLRQSTFFNPGYIQIGWSSEPNGDKDIELDDPNADKLYTETRNQTIYAVWQNIHYKVRFHSNIPETEESGGEMEDQEFIYDYPDQYFKMNQFTRTGYNFRVWHLDEEHEYFDGAQVPNLSTEDGAIVDLYAVWDKKQYTIIIKDEEGEILDEIYVTHGEKLRFYGQLPEKDADAENTYVAKWTDGENEYDSLEEIPEITGDAEFTIKFAAVPKPKYTITWKNSDANGTVLETDEGVTEGTVPVYNGATPVKASDNVYNYTFAGWTPTVGAATKDQVYTATYRTSYKQGYVPPAPPVTYTVTWKNYNGTVLETDRNLTNGTWPTYDGEDPVKPAEGDTIYTFSGWTPVIKEVSGDSEYTATFTKKTVKKYNVKFVDEDGKTVLKAATAYAEGTPASEIVLPETPTKASDDEYSYKFVGWSPTLSDVNGNVKYKAVYSATALKKNTTGEDDEPKSSFGKLFARFTEAGDNYLVVSWEKIDDAVEYEIYASQYSSKDVKRIATVKNSETSYKIEKMYGNELLKSTYYKAYVVAYKMEDGVKKVSNKSVFIHGTTTNPKYGVAESIQVKAASKKRLEGQKFKKNGNAATLTLKVGQKFKIKGVESNPTKIIISHRSIRFESSNSKVAAVYPKSGWIRADAVGTCTIYVYAQNGIYTTVTVKVKA